MEVLDRLAAPSAPQGRLVVAALEDVLQRLPPAAACADMRFRVEAGQALEALKLC